MLSGLHVYNDELFAHGRLPIHFPEYLATGHFVSATFENWESEFLQMGLYIVLTVKLFQAGSAESRPLPGEKEPSTVKAGREPWPVQRGGWVLRIYENSLAIAFSALFVASFIAHWVGSWRLHRMEAILEGQPTHSLLQHLSDAEFWFESFQNWQSEFIAILAIVILSIYLRQKDSPQSKPVEAPHSQTGD